MTNRARKGGKKNRKWGRFKIKCAAYTNERRRDKNKKRKLLKYLKNTLGMPRLSMRSTTSSSEKRRRRRQRAAFCISGMRGRSRTCTDRIRSSVPIR